MIPQTSCSNGSGSPLAHPDDMPHVQEGRQPRSALPAFQDDRNDRATPFGELPKDGFNLKFLPRPSPPWTDENRGRPNGPDVLLKFSAAIASQAESPRYRARAGCLVP